MKLEKFTIRPSLKMYIPQIILIAWLFGVLLYIRVAVLPYSAPHGIAIHQIFDIKNNFIRSKLINILYYRISFNFICYVIYGLMVILANFILGFWVKTKFTYYTFTNKYFEIGQGVFDQLKDSIDMVTIRDQELHRTASDIAWGLSRVKIWSKDDNQPLFEIKGVLHADADRVFEHLKKFSIRTFADYRLAQDMEKGEAEETEKSAKEDSVDDTVVDDKSE